ncbi:hypothetical protein HPP92_006729 [Vanilla planifolia]|uniref:acyl-[acyl-carrier-protein] 4-desaturase n=1 Tax=Vanilla planifolia TaxID=51239 RepID=A0A835VB76_VANPL|nr:hypothetical protein HPP92_006998 [Vanilla planifolia]KAG0489866.1 hypothetical protein HPP92_006729 [Vanilla planifolia]
MPSSALRILSVVVGGPLSVGLRGLEMASTVSSSPRTEVLREPFSPPREVHEQITHSMSPQKVEIFKSLQDWAKDNILVHLKPVEKCWQPQDFLPDPSSESFHDDVKELRQRSKELPDDYFVVLVGDMITEEALPTYQTMLNTLDGVRDETGAKPHFLGHLDSGMDCRREPPWGPPEQVPVPYWKS